MMKRAISTLIALSVVIGTGVQAFAEPITEAQQKQIQENRDKYADVNSKIDDLTSKIDDLDDQIQPLVIKIDKNNDDIKKAKGEIDSTEKAINKARKELQDKEKVFGERIRAIYKSGGQESYLALLLSSKNMNDLVSKMQAVGKIMSIDKKIITELNNKKKELDDKVKELQAKNEELEKLNKETQTQLDELNKKKDEQLKLVAQLKEEQKKALSNLTESERVLIEYPISIINNSDSSIEDLRNARKMLDAARVKVVSSVIEKQIQDYDSKAVNLIEEKKKAKTTSTFVPSRGAVPASSAPAPSASASSVVSYAYQFLGTPYVWGATGPSTFDCSGFTSYVYRKFGVNIGRTTYDQVTVGTPVSRGELQPGDLVFERGSASAPQHVGIYVGGGQIIHAPRTGDVVKVGPIYDYVAARRVN
ncbi:hypothetical protein CPJCM30710_09640 [Clostridium polyendosporum]|uniref:NlpC/P60 domain-containing protein n=1 Tax=Clostridium polyendosporum TaxID=69208 RepID=A0A919S0D5_9CLOT|nr:C40 family peptidase [Clostridium polyendosporum]GIM28298.1 hypothetical protein CPJCM30710_09640 [Clostridium polyendosporum]